MKNYSELHYTSSVNTRSHGSSTENTTPSPAKCLSIFIMYHLNTTAHHNFYDLKYNILNVMNTITGKTLSHDSHKTFHSPLFYPQGLYDCVYICVISIFSSDYIQTVCIVVSPFYVCVCVCENFRLYMKLNLR